MMLAKGSITFLHTEIQIQRLFLKSDIPNPSHLKYATIKGNKTQDLRVKIGDFLYKRGGIPEVMSPVETVPQQYHTDRGNTFRKVTAAPEGFSSFNTWNNSETLQSKDGILKEQTSKIRLLYQNIK